MGQITKGVRSILSLPKIYNLSQNLMGANWIRREFIEEFVRPQKNSSILDVGCGTAEILACLPETVMYWGFDISKRYIESAQCIYGKRGGFQIGLIDEQSIKFLPKFDIILLIGVLHHLDDVEVQELFKLLKIALNDGGRIVTMDPCFDIKQHPIAKFIINHDRGHNVRDALGYKGLINPIFPHIRGITRHRAWIPYTHFIMECSNDPI